MSRKRLNAIILTNGLTGSSVLTGLIAQAGYWTGTDTCRKFDYDTYENRDLIKLNKQIIGEAGYCGDYSTEFSQHAIETIAKSYELVDHSKYRAFVRESDLHTPWVWKDPRLWLTIRFWKHFLDAETTRFILLTRDPRQLWISTILRRQIQSFGYSTRYQDAVRLSIEQFFKEEGLIGLPLVFEDFVCFPEKNLQLLNSFLGTEITIDDLKQVYNRPLYKAVHGSNDAMHARLVYLWNYKRRLQ